MVEQAVAPKRPADLLNRILESAMEKIFRFDEDLITLALSLHILVLDMDALAARMTGYDRGDQANLIDKALDSAWSLEFEGYIVIARTHRGWEAVSTLLVELNQVDQAMLERLLRHCARLSSEYIEDNGGLYDVLTSREMLAADLAGERQERREQDGYMSLASAAAFLEQARSRTLARHVAEKQWDYDTRRYFKALGTTAGTGAPKTASPDHADSAERQQFRDLLKEAGIIEPPSVQKQLTYDGPNPEHIPLARAMQTLRWDKEQTYGRRLGEVTYLANVLMAGCPFRARRFRPLEAAQAAMATCQLGAELLTGLCTAGAQDPDPAYLIRMLAGLLVDTDMVRLFNCGWRILHERVAMPAARSLAELMRRVKRTIRDTRRRRDLAGKLLSLDQKIKAARPWLFVPEMEDLLGELDNDLLAQLSDLLGQYPILPSALRRPEDITRLPVIQLF